MDWVKSAPQINVLKSPDFKTNNVFLGPLDLTQTFEYTFHQFAYSTATCRVF